MKEKNLPDEIEELLHGKTPLSANEYLDDEYNKIKAEFSLPGYGIEIETGGQYFLNTETTMTENQYDQEKAELKEMKGDDIIIL